MARGWESKSVEEQQSEAREKGTAPKYRLSPAQAARVRELEGIRLARKRVVQQITAVQDPRHLKILQESLAELDRKIQAIEDQSVDSSSAREIQQRKSKP